MFHKLPKSFVRSITSNKRGAVLVVLLFAIFLTVAPTHIAHGDALDWVWDKMTNAIGSMMYAVILAPLVWILAGVGILANYMVQPIQITTSNTVQMGWGITRDFANMFFILILLGIALDYILMGVSFGVKKALPTFIAVALLINFSLPIAGVFIDFSNILTSFFLNQIGGAQFSETFATLIGIPRIFEAKTLNDATDQIGVNATNVADIIFAIFFVIGNIFVLLALSFMFLIRTGMLMGLLVILPLVLVVMPFNKSYWGKWSGKFMQYIMFAPAATFFLYLSMKIFEGNIMSNINASLAGGVTGKQGLLDQIVQYIVIWFFMGGSLVAANSFGVHGSGAALKMFKQGEGWVKGKIKGGAMGTGRKAYQYGRMGAEKAGADKALDKVAQIAGRIPIAGGWASRQLTKGSMRIQEAKKEIRLTDEEKNVIEKGDSNQVTNLITSYQNSGLPEQRVKAAKLLALDKKGKFKIRGGNGIIDTEATRDIKWKLRERALAIGDLDTIKAIDRSDFVIAEKGIAQRYSKMKDEDIDPDTGKTVKYMKEKQLEDLYRKIDITKEDWDDSIVDEKFAKNMIKYGAYNSERIKQAQRSGNMAIIEEFGKLIKKGDENTTKDLMDQKNSAFRSWLKRGAAQDYMEDYGSLIKKMERVVNRAGGKIGETEYMEQKLKDDLEDWQSKRPGPTKKEED